MENLKKKFINSLIWNAFNVFFKQGLSILIYIILARLLLPEDFGIIGMLSIFIQLSLRLQGAGLGEALIRKKDVSQEEYNFVFFYGIFIGLALYALLFFLAPFIADFYEEPRLTLITRLLCLNFLIIPLSGINRVHLIKQLEFNKIAIIEISAGLISGILAVILAFSGFGVWSLVAQNISLYFVTMILILYFIRKLPTFAFDKTASMALFSFGSQLMIANFLQTGFRNIYNMIIGKQYTASDLGYYVQGMKLQNIPGNAVNMIIKNVSFPAFATIKAERKRFKQAFRKTNKLLTFINFSIFAVLTATAPILVPFLLSDKWLPTVPFFQMLAVVGMLEPVKSLFINILKVEGKAGELVFYILFTKIFHIAGILIAVQISIHAIVISQVAASILELLIFANTGKYIDYSLREFIKDITPNLLIACAVAGILFFFNAFTRLHPFATLTLDFIISTSFFLFICELTSNETFMEIKKEILPRMKSLKKTFINRKVLR